MACEIKQCECVFCEICGHNHTSLPNAVLRNKNEVKASGHCPTLEFFLRLGHPYILSAIVTFYK